MKLWFIGDIVVKKIISIQNMLKSESIKNIVLLMSGSTMAQIIPLAISPILTRIYSPSEFGVFSLYFSIVMILAPFITGRYELSIMLPKSETESRSIVYLSNLITIGMTIILFLLVFIFKDLIITNLNIRPKQAGWIYLIPLGALSVGLFNTYTYANNRVKHYRVLSSVKVIQSSFYSLLQLVLGYLKFGYWGLIIGYLFGQLYAAYRLLTKFVAKDQGPEEKVTKGMIIEKAKEYSEFPRFAMVTHSLETLSSNIPQIMLTRFFNAKYAGYYSLTTRTIGLPMSLIGKAVGDIFLADASRLYRENGECVGIFKKTLGLLSIIPIIPLVFLYFKAEDIFIFVFGKEWGEVAEYVRILFIPFYLQFISSPLSHMFIIAKKVRVELFIQIFIAVLTILSFVFGSLIFKSDQVSLMFFAFTLTLKYIIFIYSSYRFSKGN